MFGILKHYMPRGLYWRAALILALPFLALQVIVSAGFIQRHFEDVTRQMVNTASVSIDHVLAQAAALGVDETARQTALPLEIDLSIESASPEQDERLWYDLSGVTVIARFRELYDVLAIDLTNTRRVTLWVDQDGITYQLGFERRRVSARNPHQLLVLMVVAGLVMIGISFIFLRNQLRPIRRLSRAAEAFGRGRHEPYAPSGAFEVRAAGNAFLDMRARIERQIEQRTLLLSGVSHDLRTPLTRMRLGLSLMGDEEEVEALRHDVEDMSQMIDAFLDFARVGAGEEAVEIDLAALLNECVEDARRTGLLIDTGGEFPPITMPLRPVSVRRTVANLLSNAARYGTRTRISCDVFDRSVRIRVEDDGPGIPVEAREAAMRPFMRLDPARGQNEGGSVGLGLAIAADTARRHGGTLRLGESETLGGLAADVVLAR